MIQSSIGSSLWRHLYITKEDGTSKDILQDGNVSCAFYVSSLLKHFNLSPATYANVKSLELALLEYGWKEVNRENNIQNIPLGSLIIWGEKEGIEKKDIYGNMVGAHSHIGFYVGEDQAISNMSGGFRDDNQSAGTPGKHHYTYNNTRPITSIISFNFTMTLAEQFAQQRPTMLINKQLEIPLISQFTEDLELLGLNTEEELARALGASEGYKYWRMCGPICIAMAGKYFKQDHEDILSMFYESKDKNYLKTINNEDVTYHYRNQDAGWYYDGLIKKAQEAYGLQGSSGYINPQDENYISKAKDLLAECVDNQKILICSVSPEFTTDKRGGHLVIARGYNRNGSQEELFFNDPLTPIIDGIKKPRAVLLSDFLQSRSGKYIILDRQ
jgi:hypothetical protein